jgi:flagellar motility protein MotE (MotC chaperone)
MSLRPRLIPAVILAATVLLGFKVSDIFSIGGTSHALAQAPSPTPATGAPIDLTSQANAATKPPPPPATASPPNPAAGPSAAAAPNAPPPAAAPGAPAVPATAAAAPATATTAPATDAAAPATADANPPQTADAPATQASPRAPIKDPLLLSPAEIEVLQELSQRRSALDERASELDQQQVVLQAAEKRVDEKIAKLESLQKSIQAAVDKQNAADDARTQSLVKIYETMKPADAAQILSQLEMPIVLQMFSHMKEAKTAPIFAAMDPMKAEAITSALARKQTQPVAIPAATTAAATAPASAPTSTATP